MKGSKTLQLSGMRDFFEKTKEISMAHSRLPLLPPSKAVKEVLCAPFL